MPKQKGKGAKKSSKANFTNGDFAWSEAKETLLNSLVRVLEHASMTQLWKMAAPEEGATFVGSLGAGECVDTTCLLVTLKNSC